MDAESIRNKIVDFALTCAGLGADPAKPDNKKRYIELIAPGEIPHTQDEMAKMSGCALLIGGIWRHVGVNASALQPPYKVGTAISRLVTIARSANAWIPFKAGEYPGPGDMVLVGDNGKGGVEHVYTVVGIEMSDEKVAIRSIDGGQRDAKSHQLVLLKERVWRGRQDIVVNASDPGGQKAGGRVIQGWVDVSKLPIKA